MDEGGIEPFKHKAANSRLEYFWALYAKRYLIHKKKRVDNPLSKFKSLKYFSF